MVVVVVDAVDLGVPPPLLLPDDVVGRVLLGSRVVLGGGVNGVHGFVPPTGPLGVGVVVRVLLGGSVSGAGALVLTGGLLTVVVLLVVVLRVGGRVRRDGGRGRGGEVTLDDGVSSPG